MNKRTEELVYHINEVMEGHFYIMRALSDLQKFIEAQQIDTA